MMKFIRYPLFSLAILFSLQLKAGDSKTWNGKQCAVVLTYDDALNVHLDNVIPALDSAGIHGTFYVIGESPAIRTRTAAWRLAAKHGHELGNHTLNHPCDGSLQGRSWVSSEADLSKYTLTRTINEIKVTNTLLQAIDGKKERTFAFPCGDIKIGGVDFYRSLESDFAGARGVQQGLLPLQQVELNNICCFAMNGQKGEEMIDLVKKAMASKALLVFLFHGVGGEHDINVSLEAHRQLIHYLKKHKRDIWIAPMVDVCRYIRSVK